MPLLILREYGGVSSGNVFSHAPLMKQMLCLLSLLYVCLHMFMCAHMHVCLCVSVHACMHMQVEVRVQPQVSFIPQTLCVFEAESLAGLELVK